MIRALALSAIAATIHAADGYWLTVTATAYCPCALCCDTRTERTANGTNTNRVPYGIAASPDIRLGSRVYVPAGIGYLDNLSPSARWYPADDRGGALRSDWHRYGVTRIDLRYKDHADAKAFGRKVISVYVVPEQNAP